MYKRMHQVKPGTPRIIEEKFSPWYEGVRLGLESLYADDLSDDYKLLVDLATDPNEVIDRPSRIAKLIERLNPDDNFVSACVERAAYLFDESDLLQQYRAVLGEIATMYPYTGKSEFEL